MKKTKQNKTKTKTKERAVEIHKLTLVPQFDTNKRR
jgi:hypothetical protein